MILAVTIRERGATPRHLRKAMTAAKRKGWLAAGVWWHTECRPKHFTRKAYQIYGYTPRMGEGGTATKIFKRSYTGRKLKKFGHTNPMVWSGVSERLTRARDVRATAKGVRIVMNAPALNFRPKGGRINLRAELQTLTHSEVMHAARIIDSVIDRELDAYQETTVTKVA